MNTGTIYSENYDIERRFDTRAPLDKEQLIVRDGQIMPFTSDKRQIILACIGHFEDVESAYIMQYYRLTEKPLLI